MIFITGGARSGKSHFALLEAQKLEPPITFLATAQAFDTEMTERIIRHRLERQAFGWQTKEVHLEITTALLETKTVVLLDCLSL